MPSEARGALSQRSLEFNELWEDAVIPPDDRRTDKNQAALARAAEAALGRGERIVAMLPYAHTEKRPKGPQGKVKTGVYQSSRCFRPLVLTDRRLLIFEAGRTPWPRGVLAAVPIGDAEITSISPARFHSTRVVLDLPGEGPVPLVAGRKDQVGLGALVEMLGPRVRAE